MQQRPTRPVLLHLVLQGVGEIDIAGGVESDEGRAREAPLDERRLRRPPQCEERSAAGVPLEVRPRTIGNGDILVCVDGDAASWAEVAEMDQADLPAG